MKTILWFAYYWCLLFAYIPALRKAKKAKKTGNIKMKNALVDTYVSRWTTNMVKMAGVTVEVRGQENIPEGAAVYVGNHQGRFDLLVLLSSLPNPAAFIARDNLEKKPLIKTWIKLLGCIVINRDNLRQAVTALNDAGDMVAEEGRSVVIFPEGIASKDGIMREFKPGSFRIATKAKSSLVPFCIQGTNKIMESNNNLIKSGKVILSILPPIEVGDLSHEDNEMLPQRVHTLVEDELKKIISENK